MNILAQVEPCQFQSRVVTQPKTIGWTLSSNWDLETRSLLLALPIHKFCYAFCALRVSKTLSQPNVTSPIVRVTAEIKISSNEGIACGSACVKNGSVRKQTH